MGVKIDGIEYDTPPLYKAETGARGTWCSQCQDTWLGEREDCPFREPDTPKHPIEHVTTTFCERCSAVLAPAQVAGHETSERHARAGVPMYRADKPLKRSAEERYGKGQS